MCQICERVTVARLSCPERSRPKDRVSPIAVVPLTELAASDVKDSVWFSPQGKNWVLMFIVVYFYWNGCEWFYICVSLKSILWQAELWLMLMCDFRRKEQHCSAAAGPRVLHWALVTNIHAAIQMRHWTVGEDRNDIRQLLTEEQKSGGLNFCRWP